MAITWKDYLEKSKPADTDELMALDTTASANKRVKFSGIWDWIVDKMATAVMSKLETQNKTLIGAVNELNSNGNAVVQKISTGKLDENGNLIIRPFPIDSFSIFSFHSRNVADGGIAVLTAPYYVEIISTTCHNSGTISISGNTTDGINFHTNCPNGDYRLIVFKNYETK